MALWWGTQLDNGVRLQDIKVDLQLFGLKSIHAWWIVNFFNNITTLKGQKIIESRWKAAGILDELELEVWKNGFNWSLCWFRSNVKSWK